jgi:hypothetical protein
MNGATHGADEAEANQAAQQGDHDSSSRILGFVQGEEQMQVEVC